MPSQKVKMRLERTRDSESLRQVVEPRHPRSKLSSKFEIEGMRMPSSKLTDQSPSSMANFVLYAAPNGKVNLNVVLRDETVWLTQTGMADLFAVQVPAINKHLKNIFETAELLEPAVVSVLETTAADGKHWRE